MMFSFSYLRPQDMSPKMKIFVPVCICKLYLVVFVAFGVMAFFCMSSLPVHVGTGLVSLWIITLSYQLQPAPSQGAFSFLSGMMEDIPMVFILAYNCLNR